MLSNSVSYKNRAWNKEEIFIFFVKLIQKVHINKGNLGLRNQGQVTTNSFSKVIECSEVPQDGISPTT